MIVFASIILFAGIFFCLIYLLRKTPFWILVIFRAGVFAITAVLYLTAFSGILVFLAFFIALIFLFLTSSLFALIYLIIVKEFKDFSLIKKTVVNILLIMVLLINTYEIYWLLYEGSDEHLVSIITRQKALVETQKIPNPSEPGIYETKLMFYGSGNDKQRKEYAEEVDFISGSVDLSPYLPQLHDYRLKWREYYWGFDLNASPLNARVWLPIKEGQYPLVCIALPNNPNKTNLESGYDYIGKLLASNGYIVAILDQNFLNSSRLGGDFGGAGILGRGIHILEHLKLWHEWNEREVHPFYKIVDTYKIALIGHSRGGEAVIVASATKKFPYSPDNANLLFDYGFSIKSLVSIATY